MFSKISASRKKPTRNRPRTLRLESLDKRELMDAAGMGPLLPALGPEPPQEIYSSQPHSSVARASISSSSTETINRGDVKSTSLTRAGQVVEYSWQVSGRESFQVTVAPQKGAAVRYELFAPGQTRPMADYSGVTGSERILRVLYTGGQPGNMVLRVTALNSTVNGRVFAGLESISRPSDDATLVRKGRVVSGTLREPIAVNQHFFNSNQRETVQIAITPEGNQPLRYQIFAPGSAGRVDRGISPHDGTRPFGHEGFYGITRKPILLTLPTAGTSGQWIIQVQSNNFSRNVSYKIGVETITAPSPNATAVQRGFSQVSEIRESLQANQFKLNVRARENYQINIAPIAGYRVSYQVFAPGIDRPVAGFSGTTSTPLTLNLRTVSTGEYLIVIRAENLSSTGSFRLNVR